MEKKLSKRIKNAKTKSIIVTDDAFKFLEKYGLNVISLDEDTIKKIIKNALELNIEKIEIITISNNQKIDNKKINIETIVFYEWALI